MHSVAEILRALQLNNLIACVDRDYPLITGRPFCCSPAESGPGFVEVPSVMLSWWENVSWQMRIQLSMGWFWFF